VGALSFLALETYLLIIRITKINEKSHDNLAAPSGQYRTVKSLFLIHVKYAKLWWWRHIYYQLPTF